MEFKKLGEMLWELARADEGPERKLNELLWQLDIPDRVELLDYILKEYKRGTIENMVHQRIEHEGPSGSLDLSEDGLTPTDAYFLHLTNLWEQISKMCTISVPAKLQEYERDISEFRQRKKVMDALNVSVNEAESEERLLSTDEAAAFLGVSKATLYSYNHKRLLEPITIGGKMVYYSKNDLLKVRKRKEKDM